jgi:hypothetical protein
MTMKNENEKSCLVHDTVYVDGSDYSKKKRKSGTSMPFGVFHVFAEPSTIDHRPSNQSVKCGRERLFDSKYRTPVLTAALADLVQRQTKPH